MAQNRCISCMNVIDSPVCPYCGYPVHNQTQPHQLPVGTVLRGRYQVGRVLGQGGFGITYIAWDTLMENVVAVKEFFPGSTVNRNTAYSPTVQCNTTNMGAHYEASKERFLREAKALVRFRNVPEVVDILDFMEENNTAYIVMEFVRGVDLAKYIQGRGGRLSVEETFRILKPVMEALATVHKGGIVHRDISPDNIILDPMGGAKLLDFGAVRSVDNPDVDKALNKSTEAILKQGFAPLEQYNTRGSLGPWTDEYAMCATVFYCLTGRIPEDASIRVTEGIDPDWDSIEGLPQYQKRALEKGMSVRAKDRYPDMDALMVDLFGEPTAQPAPQPEPAVTAPVTVTVPAAPAFEPTVAIGTPPVQPPVQQPQTPPADPVAMEQKPKKKLWPVLAAVAAVLVVAILAGIMLPKHLEIWRGYLREIEQYRATHTTYTLQELLILTDALSVPVDNKETIWIDGVKVEKYNGEWYASITAIYYDDNGNVVYGDDFTFTTDRGKNTNGATYSLWVSGSVHDQIETIVSDSGIEYHWMYADYSDIGLPSYHSFFVADYVDGYATEMFVSKEFYDR